MTTAIYTHPDCLRHEMGSWHPECPERLQAIEDQLIASRIDTLIERREAPAAELAALARVHSEQAIAAVRDNTPEPDTLEPALGAEDDAYAPHAGYHAIDPDTSLNAHSWEAALRAAGAAVAATDAVIAGELDNAFCSIRPPGHHARPDGSMGFCLFNNVAIAARHALEHHGLERVAIVDFDVHHGNGTEEAFADEPRVLMVSFFQHPFYPYTGTGPASHRPNMVNVPVPAYTTGEAVRHLVTGRWLPALHAHRPQMIFISAGFDAHREDDLGQMGLVEADYAWITGQVMEVAQQYANGRIVSCLEGGYNLSALGRSVAAHLKVLAGLV
jgi:acetoin utilization deacetylase AcuC-like enzyme